MDFFNETVKEVLVQVIATLVTAYAIPYVIRWIVRGRNIKKNPIIGNMQQRLKRDILNI